MATTCCALPQQQQLLHSPGCSSSRRPVLTHVSSINEEVPPSPSPYTASQVPFNYSLRNRHVFLLDVQPLCYQGSRRNPFSFIHWIKLLYQNVAGDNPIIAVLDGDRGYEYRRSIMPGYKSNRQTFNRYLARSRWTESEEGRDVKNLDALPWIEYFFAETNVPVVKIEDAESDDVVATLTAQIQEKGLFTVIASPDKDFRQLISTDVKLVIPMPDLQRWSFHTIKHYVAQNGCDPSVDLSLRCMLGDKNDCVPGLPEVIPGFGRKTAIKLLKKHGSLENILKAAAVRTIGKPYVQDAFTKHAKLLYRNLQVLKLRRDVAVSLAEEWCLSRRTYNDLAALSRLELKLK